MMKMVEMNDAAARSPAIRDRLQHVYWIGGGSGAGKSTVATSIAAKHGFALYDTDRAMANHRARMAPQDSPLLRQFINMAADERWVSRSPQVMLETFHWFRGEGFELIVEDLLEISVDQPVIVEGFRLLPTLVDPLLTERHHAVWLIPSPEFRRAAFEARRPAGPPWSFVNETSDPHQALTNLLERDALFSDMLRDEVQRLGLPAIEVGVGSTKNDVADLVAASLGL